MLANRSTLVFDAFDNHFEPEFESSGLVKINDHQSPGIEHGHKETTQTPFKTESVFTEEMPRFNVELKAKQSINLLKDKDVPLTYLNMNTAYEVVVRSVGSVIAEKLRIYLFLTFYSEADQAMAEKYWKTWYEHCNYKRACYEAIEVKPLNVKEEEGQLIPFVNTQDPTIKAFAVLDLIAEPTMNFSIRLNFLSTDFTSFKGVRGHHVKLSVIILEQFPQQIYVSENVAVLLSFRDKGAERKHRDDVKKLLKKGFETAVAQNTTLFYKYPSLKVTRIKCNEIINLCIKQCLYNCSNLEDRTKKDLPITPVPELKKHEKKILLQSPIESDPLVSERLLAMNYFSEKRLGLDGMYELKVPFNKMDFQNFLGLDGTNFGAYFLLQDKFVEIFEHLKELEDKYVGKELYCEIHKVCDIFYGAEYKYTHVVFLYDSK